LVVVFLEDSAALIDLTIAMAALLLEHTTGILFFDSWPRSIGVLLAVTPCSWATRPSRCSASADPALLRRIRLLLLRKTASRVIIRSLHLGAEDILLAIGEFNPGSTPGRSAA
jgi:hypothetical protein